VATQKPIRVSWQNPSDVGITEVTIIRQTGPGNPVQYHKATSTGIQDVYDIPITGLGVGNYTFSIFVKNSAGQSGPPVTFTGHVGP
jgi:hypothetical protein